MEVIQTVDTLRERLERAGRIAFVPTIDRKSVV